MQYTDNEAALIGGLISNYFFQPSVDAKLRESYRRVLRHLHENTLSASDLSRIQNALTFLSPLCRDTREAHKDMMGVTLKTDALIRASRYTTTRCAGSGCFAFSRPSIANTPCFRPGVGWSLPAVLTSETSHSWLTRWHLCLECVFDITNKNAGRNSTLCRGQKRAAFPKNSRKSGSKRRG